MRATNRQGRWATARRLATEYGQFFDDWDKKNNGGSWTTALLADYEGKAISWTNNAGAAEGTAAFRLPYSTFNIVSADYEDEHTVHLRVTENTQSSAFAIGPATTLNGAGSIHDCYFVEAQGTQVRIGKVLSGVVSTLATAAATTVFEGDVISIAYRYDITGGDALLAAMVNGVEVATHTDMTDPIRMSSVSGRFGIFGDSSPSLANTLNAGHILNEWWVTDGWESYEEAPPFLQSLARGLRIYVKNRSTSTIRHVLSGVLTRCRWSVKRLGGCASLNASFRFPASSSTRERPASAEAQTWVDPKSTDWTQSEWMGGEVVLALHYSGARLDESPTLTTIDQDSVWRGRVESITYDPNTQSVRLSAVGLVKELDEVFLRFKNLTATVRNHVLALIQGAKIAFPATLFQFNPTKIVGTQSALDLQVRVENRGSNVRRLLDKVLAYLPDSVVWGVDRQGDFFLDQQLDHYTEALSGAGILHVNVGRPGVKYERTTSLAKLANGISLLGKEDEGSGGTSLGGRVEGAARCDRSQSLFGPRGILHTDSQVQSQGLALKMALVRLKKLAIPEVSAKLEVTEPVRGLRSLYQTLVAAAPRVAVSEQDAASQPGPVSDVGDLFLQGTLSTARKDGGGWPPVAGGDRSATEYLLQMFDDQPAIALGGQGSLGDGVSLASSSAEQGLNLSWLIHVALRFDFAHPGGTGDLAFLLGRRDNAAAATDWGWGMLVWHKTGASTGTLEWRYSSSTGSARTFSLGISVPPAGSGTVVNLSIYREANGTWRVYNGTSLIGTAAAPPATTDTLQSTTAAWEWFKTDASTPPANVIQGDVTLEHFWLMPLGPIEAQEHTLTPIPEFISRNNASPLQRMDGNPLLYIPFREESLSFRGCQLGSSGMVSVAPTFTQATAIANQTPIGGQLRAGARVGSEKKFGGPLVFDAERVTYEYDGMSGLLKRSFDLGAPPPGLIRTLAEIGEQQRQLVEVTKRFTEDL